MLRHQHLRRVLLLVPAVLLAYLALAAAWAWTSFDDALASIPAGEQVTLSARQTAILLRVEDPNFHHHAGLGIAPGQGVATISSALAREIFLGDGRLGGMRGALQAFYRGVFDCCKRIDLGRDVMALVLDARYATRQRWRSAPPASGRCWPDSANRMAGSIPISRVARPDLHAFRLPSEIGHRPAPVRRSCG